MRLSKALLVFASFAMAASNARADVKPHPLFSDNMVLQQGVDVLVWGKAAPGENVSVQIEGKSTGSATAAGGAGSADKDGNWAVKFGKLPAGTGYVLTIKGNNTITYKNVAVGEVWVCSGQSNMEWPINISETPDKVKAAAKNPNLRLYTVHKRTAAAPISDQGDLSHFTKWVESDTETVGNFSAVGSHFGQKFQKELGVPVGLIHSSWGGTPCQAWTSLEALEANPMLKHYADQFNNTVKQYEAARAKYDPKKVDEAFKQAHDKWKADAEKARAEGKPVPKEPKKPGPPDLGPGTPTVLYNAMIYPLLKYKLRGAIWYQGESNAGQAYEYRTLFPAMIEDWRQQFACDLPFMLVQLAPFSAGNSAGVHSAELRDAQLLATKKLPKVGMAVITDVGDEKDIHPKPKQPVGERLAIAALGIAYEKPIEYSGPLFKEAEFDGSTATLRFDHRGKGLVSHSAELTGFTVAGADQVFYPAEAEIVGDVVKVRSAKVQKIVAVRYGWVNFAKPTLSLFNKEGLPASPFRTDDFPLTTQPRK
jgi:sialate O-acetylesterase